MKEYLYLYTHTHTHTHTNTHMTLEPLLAIDAIDYELQYIIPAPFACYLEHIMVLAYHLLLLATKVSHCKCSLHRYSSPLYPRAVLAVSRKLS